MSDTWEDWENDDYEVPVLNVQQTEEQLKRIEERKLVEESDNALTNDLFQKENKTSKEKGVEEDLVYEELKLFEPSVKNKNITQKNQLSTKKKPEKKMNKQKENEEKQKAISKMLKEKKARREKEAELFGEVEYDDEYADYEDKFY